MNEAERRRVVIMGAAGRDFHNFNMAYRDNPLFEVVAFTATQIPGIEGKTYPVELAGSLYPNGIPIHPEEELESLIFANNIDLGVLSYSDLSHQTVMEKASRVLAAGADFKLLGPNATMLTSQRPVIAICAVRTGCGKSQTTRMIADSLREKGKKVVVVRHPMPYGDLAKQTVQRFASRDDLKNQQCTIEEREEFEPLIDRGMVVYAGIDYGRILVRAEREADVILWDGGNNDIPFFRPDVHIVVADPLRPGQELTYYPGRVNLRMANIVLINKVNTAEPEQVNLVEENCRVENPDAVILHGESIVSVDGEIEGKRVLVVEDGPTLTHGDMPYGAGIVAAKRFGAEIVPPNAVGSIKKIMDLYPHLSDVLPAMGYSKAQREELQQSINDTPCDLVLSATPIDLSAILSIKHPVQRVRYDLRCDALVDEVQKRLQPALEEKQ